MYREVKLHHKQKRFYRDDKACYIVFKTYKNFPYYKEPIFCDLFIEELKLVKKMKKFKLFGFCLIYDHVNLLLKPTIEFNISKIIKSLKENVSRDINYIISNTTNEGDTSTCRLHLREMIAEWQNKFIDKYGQSQYDIPEFRWQKSFYDHIIRHEKDFYSHYRYITLNYLKHGLPENWPYTSFNYEDLIDYIEW
jgi:REP element-mobilizing transposase RayT